MKTKFLALLLAVVAMGTMLMACSKDDETEKVTDTVKIPKKEYNYIVTLGNVSKYPGKSDIYLNPNITMYVGDSVPLTVFPESIFTPEPSYTVSVQSALTWNEKTKTIKAIQSTFDSWAEVRVEIKGVEEEVQFSVQVWSK